MANFEPIVCWVLYQEDDHRSPGKIVNLNDGAGLTRLGMTQRWHQKDLPMEFFSTMNFKDAVKAAKIAYKKQWDQLKLDLIESDLVAAPLFSFAVNTGNSPAVKTLQKVLGVTEDGFIGTTTIAEVNQKDPEIVAKLYRAEWTSWYQGLVKIAPAKLPFLHEWLARAGFPYPTSIPEIYSA